MGQLYDKFLAALSERYPRKSDLVNELTHLLHLEKESVYRRLRKDVYFSAEETMRIAAAWSISVDNITKLNSEKNRPSHLRMVNYADPEESDYLLLEQYNRDLELIARDPEGRIYEVLNSLPRGLFCRSEILTRFFTMKWYYKYANCDRTRPLSDIHITDRMRTIDAEMIRRQHAIPEMHSIHDRRIFENLIEEIAFFRSIGMISPEEIELLRGDLLALVDYLEEVTLRSAFWPESGGKLFFYLSHTWLETSYTLHQSHDFVLTLVRILERNSIVSTDRVFFDRMLNMVQSMKHSSVLISGSNALQQAEFFSHQRELIGAL